MDLVLNQNVTINDPKLKEVTTAIRKAGANVIGNTFKIAALIAKVDNDELYAADGFNDTFDYVKQCFGLEKASAYNLIKVGKDFITADESGKKYETLLTHSDRDFSISQVVKMLPLGLEKAQELTADGVIDVDMSCRAIEKIVKENTEGTAARGKKKTEPDPEPVDTTAEDVTEDETEDEDDATLMIEWDDLPDDIKKLLMDEYELDGIARIEIAGL